MPLGEIDLYVRERFQDALGLNRRMFLEIWFRNASCVHVRLSRNVC